MAITREEVRWAYRILLGREPESEEALAQHLDAANLQELRKRFMESDEFQSGLRLPLPIGRLLEAGPLDIEVECGDADLRRMLAQIAREWTQFGEHEPHWSVLVDERFLSSNIAAHEDQFFSSGNGDIAQVMHMVERSRPNARLGKALDFGCGVGRLSLSLAGRVGHVTGVDVSPPHLAIARDRAAKLGIGNVDFRSIASFDDLTVLGGGGFDLILTLIVLQHNPPPAMAELLRRLLEMLDPAGLAVFQIPTYLDRYAFRIADYFESAQPAMEMNALPQSVVFETVEKADCAVLEVREDGRIGDDGISHIFLVERRR